MEILTNLVHTLIAIIVVYSSLVAVSEGILQCPDGPTAVVERKTQNSDESNFEKLNDTHVRICQCEVRSCVKKCCGKGQIMAEDICQRNDHPSDSNIFPQLNVSGFHLIYGSGCPVNYHTRFYPDDYTNVRYYLTRNGSISIFFDADMIQLQDFCLERVFRTRNVSTGENSSLLICVSKDFPSGLYGFPIGMALSLPFLIATLIVYSFRELRNIHSRNLSSHVGSLVAAYLSVIFVEMIKVKIPEELCIFLGLVRQFSFLSSFFWLNVMSFDLWWSLSNWSGFKAYSKDKERKMYLKYSACGWGFPALIVSVTVIMDFIPTSDGFIKPSMGYPNCFLKDGKPFYAYFYGPVIFIFCVDVTLIILSALRFITAKRKMKFITVQDKIYMQSTKKRYIYLLKIFIMMGINWIIDPFSWIFESSTWTWLFIQLSLTLQAISIFIIFVWKIEIKKLLVSKFCSNSYSEFTGISLLDTSPSPDRRTKFKQSEANETTTSC